MVESPGGGGLRRRRRDRSGDRPGGAAPPRVHAGADPGTAASPAHRSHANNLTSPADSAPTGPVAGAHRTLPIGNPRAHEPSVHRECQPDDLRDVHPIPYRPTRGGSLPAIELGFILALRQLMTRFDKCSDSASRQLNGLIIRSSGVEPNSRPGRSQSGHETGRSTRSPACHPATARGPRLRWLRPRNPSNAETSPCLPTSPQPPLATRLAAG